ncbi:MAG: Ig-like domain-containing protein, partial [Gemmatimonadetes bacterium]|nr:Ig-like domain-containing protein [Gemmatimonadota bacterium]
SLRVSRRGAIALVCCAAAACGSEPSGSLEITLDAFSKVTNATNVTLGGGVTRTPPKQTTIVVRATGGLGSPVDTVRGGRFALKIDLNPNAQNQLSLVASDATGAASEALAVTIRQDNEGPTVAQMTPADTSDNAATNTTISLKMSEPVVVAPGGGLRMSRQGATVSGSSNLSADSLTFSFTPSAPLSPNAIYRLTLSGVTDVATNPVAATFSSCFATAITGAPATFATTDPSSDLFSSSGSPGTLQPPDLLAARFAREGALFSGIFRFVGPRVFSNVAANRAAVFIDLDVDQDSTTGFVTFKDTLFLASANSTNRFDTLSSGTRAEYIIGLEPHTQLGDSAYVGKYTAPEEFNVMGTFLPGVCGALMGFVAPFSVIGNDDGKINAVVMSLAASSTFLYVDPMPTKGHLTLNLAAPTPVAAFDWPASPTRGGQVFRRGVKQLLLKR